MSTGFPKFARDWRTSETAARKRTATL